MLRDWTTEAAGGQAAQRKTEGLGYCQSSTLWPGVPRAGEELEIHSRDRESIYLDQEL